METVSILLISGSTRGQSTNTAVLRTAQETAPEGVEAVVFHGLTGLPHFNPDDDRDPLPRAVAELRSEIARADAVLISTPEYAGALPGSFKNLLDWTVGGGEIYRKPVAWINASSSPTGAADAHASLRKVLGYLSVEIIEPACERIAVSRNDVGEDGLIANPDIRARLNTILTTLARHVANQA